MRLAITLRYLIKGDSCRTLEKICHISRKSISKIIQHIMARLIYIMEDKYLKLPDSQSQWTRIVGDFEKFWKFPHTLGVLDAKHFRFNLTDNLYSCRSFVLLSVLDAYGRFLYTEAIACDKETDESSIYINSNLYKLLKMNTLNIPHDEPLKGQTVATDYYFVGTDVFGLDRYILKEYHETQDLNKNQEAFNYRLNKVRIVENMAFKALFYRFRVLARLIYLHKSNVSLIIKVCCILHNYLTQTLDKPFGIFKDINFQTMPNIVIPLTMQVFEKYEKIYQRSENLCNYCVTDGETPEQWENIVKK